MFTLFIGIYSLATRARKTIEAAKLVLRDEKLRLLSGISHQIFCTLNLVIFHLGSFKYSVIVWI